MRRFQRVLCAAALVAGLGAVAAPAAEACSVPVFRYALERWPADPYAAVVFHRGELPAPSKALVERFEKAATGEQAAANLEVYDADLDGDAPEELKSIWKGLEKASTPLPRIVLLYPRGATEEPVAWSGPLSEASLSKITDSPARASLAKKLAGGESAVWIFLGSGEKKQDQEALARLEASLKQLEKKIELPEVAPQDLGYMRAGAEAETALRVAFSTLVVDRKDPREEVLVSMLLGSESGLRGPELAGKPMTFPIFGRGRSLFAFAGDGIRDETIADAAFFLTGPCSCQVKWQNPGTDLLLSYDWDSALAADLPPLEAPPLGGFEQFVDLPPAPQPEGKATPASPAELAETSLGSETSPPQRASDSTTPALEPEVNRIDSTPGPTPSPLRAPSESTLAPSPPIPPGPGSDSSSRMVRNTLFAILVGLGAIVVLSLALRSRSS